MIGKYGLSSNFIFYLIDFDFGGKYLLDFSSFSFFVLLNFTVLLCHFHSFIILLLISFMIGQDEILIYEETVLFLGFTGTTHLYFKYAESRVIYLSTLRDWCRSLK